MANNKEWSPGGTSTTSNKTKTTDDSKALEAVEELHDRIDELEGGVSDLWALLEEFGGSPQESSDGIDHMLKHFQQAQEQGLEFVPPFRWKQLDSDIDQHREALLEGYDQYCTFCGTLRKPEGGE